ncbi:hypothetical protein OROMI_025024 [Orobanche minor]
MATKVATHYEGRPSVSSLQADLEASRTTRKVDT